MHRFEVGVQIHPQHATIDELRAAWRRAEELGVDSIWTWDHFFPLYGAPYGAHFEGWTLAAAMALDTSRAKIGPLVTCNSYRNPSHLADIARTVDHLSGGRVILAVGAGWFERDYDEYGYEFGTAGDRLRALDRDLPIIKERLARLNPPPLGPMPIMVGGGGEKVTLRITAQYADMWNSFGPPSTYAHKNRVLDEWCQRVGRDPAEITRTVQVRHDAVDDAEGFLEAGATHLIVGIGHPFGMEPVERLLELAGS